MLKTFDIVLLSLHNTPCEVGGIDPILQMGRSRHRKVTWLLESRVAWCGMARQQSCAPARGCRCCHIHTPSVPPQTAWKGSTLRPSSHPVQN